MQAQGHLQMMLHAFAAGHGLQEAVDAPRWQIMQGNEVTIERGGSSTVLRIAARVDAKVGGGGGPLLVPLHAVRGQGRERRSLAFAFGIARAHGGALTAERKGADRIELTMALPG